MAKELPYFKFEPNKWENGNIQMCSRDQKGLFLDLCSMYWSRLGDMPLKLAVQKLCDGNATALNSLCEDNIIAIEHGLIRIDFLEEQLQEFKITSDQNRKNAKEGWDKRRKIKELSGGNAIASNPQSEIDARREEKRREEKKKENLKGKNISRNESFGNDLLSGGQWVDAIAYNNKILPEDVKDWIDIFNKKLITEVDDKNSKQDYASHFARWLPSEILKSKKTIIPAGNKPSFTTNR